MTKLGDWKTENFDKSMTRNERNEPTWQLPTEVKVTRMDATLAMTMDVGKATLADGHIAEIALGIGGFVFIADVRDASGSHVARYALDFKSTVEDVLSQESELRRPKNMGFPKKKATAPQKRRRPKTAKR